MHTLKYACMQLHASTRKAGGVNPSLTLVVAQLLKHAAGKGTAGQMREYSSNQLSC